MRVVAAMNPASTRRRLALGRDTAAQARYLHRSVGVAELALVVSGENGRTVGMPTHPAFVKSLGRPQPARDPIPSQHAVSHVGVLSGAAPLVVDAVFLQERPKPVD